jgi:hypothetical protein
VGGHARAVDPRHARAQADVVQDVADLEVVGAVEDEVRLADEARGEGRVHVGHDPPYRHVRVEPPQAGFGRHRLRPGERRVLLVEERLALEVRRLHEVAVHDGEARDAGPRHRLREGRPAHRSRRRGRGASIRSSLPADPTGSWRE